MSTAELKLLIIREIDRLPKDRLQEILNFLKGNTEIKSEKKRRIGALKGTLLYMADDFDDPLDDFKDYM